MILWGYVWRNQNARHLYCRVFNVLTFTAAQVLHTHGYFLGQGVSQLRCRKSLYTLIWLHNFSGLSTISYLRNALESRAVDSREIDIFSAQNQDNVNRSKRIFAFPKGGRQTTRPPSLSTSRNRPASTMRNMIRCLWLSWRCKKALITLISNGPATSTKPIRMRWISFNSPG